jgi:drug/metabolite transporter (DMT)-like permease
MIFFLFLPALFWGLSYIAIKVGLRYLTPTELISLRLVMAAPILYTILKIKKIPIRWQQDKLLYLLSGLVIFAHFFIMAHGMETVSALDTSWILTTAPIFIMLLSRLILKESISFYPIVGLIIAMFGVLALVSKGNYRDLGWLSSVDDWLVLCSCVTWAIYTILARIITRRHNSMAATYIMIMIPTILIVPFVFLHSGFSRIIAMPADGWIAVVFLGVFCLAISFWLWTEGLSRHPAAEVGVYLYLEPLVTTFAAILFLSERFTFSTLIGSAAIFAGVYISSLNPRGKALA